MTDVKTCAESRVVKTHLILPRDTNSARNLYGGQLLDWVDNTCSISFKRHTRMQGVTASVDSLNFLAPLGEGHSVCIESMVSGTGTRSVEIFVKIIGEDLTNGQRYLAATAFLTFVVKLQEGQEGYKVPAIQPESSEEVYVCSGYADRRAKRLAQRQADIDFNSNLSTNIFWVNSSNE